MRKKRQIRDRVQFLADPVAKDRYRRAAADEGRTLSEWLRRAADAAARPDPYQRALASRSQLEEFFGLPRERPDPGVPPGPRASLP